jgi:hypothetical protein
MARRTRRSSAGAAGGNQGVSILGVVVSALVSLLVSAFGKGGVFDTPKTYRTKSGKRRTYVPKGWPKGRNGRPLD